MKRLKNLKRKEIEGKLAQIRAVAGAAALPFTADALDDDFDADAHEAAMGAAFGDAYYGEDDADEGALLAAPSRKRALRARMTDSMR